MSNFTPRAQQVLAFIDRVCAEHGEDVVGDEILGEVLDEDLLHPERGGLGSGRLHLLSLADVGGEGDDLRVVAVLKPAQDDRGVEPAGVGEHDLLDGSGGWHG